jgi:NAD(P)H-flavin reductase
MNNWTELSIEYANQRSYLDDLFHVYPTIPDGVLFICGNNKMYKSITETYKDYNMYECVSFEELFVSKVI